jgi:hypothetical protein
MASWHELGILYLPLPTDRKTDVSYVKIKGHWELLFSNININKNKTCDT